ncbi:MAG: acetyl-CoA carboxylase biotin carboxyl carrier protein [Rhodospirillales bacterium]|nr:acetyl-CoA carboxylase biotin carboxyl carrier protein [Rhodospirillales bacterium]
MALGNKLDIDEKQVRRLADLLNENGLTEIEIEDGERRVKLSRQNGTVSHTGFAAPPVLASEPAVVVAVEGTSPAAAEPEGIADAVTSPMVGTVYIAPEPGSPPFVKVGDQVRGGQTLVIIEAMKVMNNLPSPRAGTVKEVLVRDGQPVEYGEALVVVA